MRLGLRISHPRQRFPRTQAGHQSLQEGFETFDVDGENESIDQEDHLPRTEDHLRREERLCGLTHRKVYEILTARSLLYVIIDN